MKKQLIIQDDEWKLVRIKGKTKNLLRELQGKNGFLTFDQTINWLIGQKTKKINPIKLGGGVS